MTEPVGQFYKDLARDMQDPEYRRGVPFVRHRIATIDRMVNELDGERVRRGLSKADLGRVLEMKDSSVRRLFTNAGANPRLSTLADLATALGFKVVLEPLSPEEAAEVDEAWSTLGVATGGRAAR